MRARVVLGQRDEYRSSSSHIISADHNFVDSDRGISRDHLVEQRQSCREHQDSASVLNKGVEPPMMF